MKAKKIFKPLFEVRKAITAETTKIRQSNNLIYLLNHDADNIRIKQQKRIIKNALKKIKQLLKYL